MRRRLLEALRIGHENLKAVRAERVGFAEWVDAGDVHANAGVELGHSKSVGNKCVLGVLRMLSRMAIGGFCDDRCVVFDA